MSYPPFLRGLQVKAMILSPPFLFDPTRDLQSLNRDIWTLPTSSLWHFLKLYVLLSDPMETIEMKGTTED